MFALKYVQPKIKYLSNGLFANWLPSAPVDIGDFGIVRKGCFERKGSLREYGFALTSKPVPSAPSGIEYKDRMEIDVDATAGANAASQAKAKVSITAKGRGAFLYHLDNPQHERPENSRMFNEELVKALAECGENFPDDGVIVTELMSATHATIVVSDGKEGSLTLATAFDPVGTAYLSGASGNVSTSASMGTFYSFIGETGTKALIKLVIPKVISPPPPGGGSGNPVKRSIAAFKDWLQSRRVGARHLRLVDLESEADAQGFSVSTGMDDERLEIWLDIMTDEEMVGTIEDISGHEIEGEFDIELDGLEIGEVLKRAQG